MNNSGENIAQAMREAIEEWKLPVTNGIPPFVTDNASNMTKACKLLGCQFHVGCFAHTINLAAQKSLKVKRVSHVLAKVRRIVAFFHKSTVAAALLKSKAEVLSLPQHKLIIDVCTRWNSAYDMSSRFLEMQCAVVSVLRSKEVGSFKDKDMSNLSDEDISLLEEVTTCLKPLKDITTLLCSENMPTISVIMPLYHKLLDMMANGEDDTPTVKEMKQVIRKDLKERYSELKDILNATSAIDPRFKKLPYLSAENQLTVFNKLIIDAAKLEQNSPRPVVKHEPAEQAAEVQRDLPPLPALPAMHDEQNEPNKVEVIPLKKSKSSVLDELLGDVYVTHITQAEPRKTPMEKAQSEISNYKDEQPIILNDNPLLWWKSHETKYPLLARLAKYLLCVPATSVPSERVFSTAGDILTGQRANLKSKHVDALIFLKKNMK